MIVERDEVKCMKRSTKNLCYEGERKEDLNMACLVLH